MGAGETAQWLGEGAALAEDLNSVPSTRTHTHSSSREIQSCCFRGTCTPAYAHTLTDRQTIQSKINLFFKENK